MISINIFLYNSFDNNCIPALKILRCTLCIDWTVRQTLYWEYFYRSLGCLQLTSSSCDIRVYLWGLPGNARLSANANAVGHYHVLFKSTFHLCFLPSKPCVSLKSVPLNSCYTKANQQWIDYFPEDRCDRTSTCHWTREWIKTKIMQDSFKKHLLANFLQMYLWIHDKFSSTNFKQHSRQREMLQA